MPLVSGQTRFQVLILSVANQYFYLFPLRIFIRCYLGIKGIVSSPHPCIFVCPLYFSSYVIVSRQKWQELLPNVNWLDIFFTSDSGISLLHKKSSEKEELCQRLKEQLDALEKETASKLSEMDTFNNQLKVFYLLLSSCLCSGFLYHIFIIDSVVSSTRIILFLIF